jgi:hypothetical protein
MSEVDPSWSAPDPTPAPVADPATATTPPVVAEVDPWKNLQLNVGHASAEDLHAVLPKITNLETAYHALTTKDTADWEQFAAGKRAEYNFKLNKYKKENHSVDDVRVLEAAYNKEVESAVAAKKKEVLASSAATRADMLRQVDQLSVGAAISNELFGVTPAQLLSIEGVGSDYRARCWEQIKNLHPMALKTFAQLAISRDDLELASCVLQRNDSLKANQRVFTSSSFAKKVMGQTWDAIRNSSSYIINLRSRMQATEKAHSAGRPMTANEKISRGVSQAQYEKLTAEPLVVRVKRPR